MLDTDCPCIRHASSLICVPLETTQLDFVSTHSSCLCSLALMCVWGCGGGCVIHPSPLVAGFMCALDAGLHSAGLSVHSVLSRRHFILHFCGQKARTCRFVVASYTVCSLHGFSFYPDSYEPELCSAVGSDSHNFQLFSLSSNSHNFFQAYH